MEATSAQWVPKHELETEDSLFSITLPESGWKITAISEAISNADELDALTPKLDLNLPEMTFGNNVLELRHKPSGLLYRFDACGVLGQVCNREPGPGDGGVKVGHAEAWMKTRAGPDATNPLPELSETKLYDWTYTTTYAGEVVSPTSKFDPADPEDPSHSIPMDQLTRKDPILYYAAVPLFEAELDDNGSSTYTIRIRVMPSCFFVLARFSLRVDNVLFRQYDTRIFHDFSSPLLIRETAGWEVPYSVLRARLPNPQDLTPLTDPQFVANTLGEMPTRVTQNKRAAGGTGWRGLGRKVDVMRLVELGKAYIEEAR